jgi:mRNA-degrading endonuclease toxin of MazEF toxin-antitoxin module
MKPWEIWTGDVYGAHPVVIVSAANRVERRNRVVVLKCTTLRPGDPWRPDELQATLDQEDGLDTRTRCVCDLFFTVDKATLTQKRGEVGWERRRDISRKMLQSLALAGL